MLWPGGHVEEHTLLVIAALHLVSVRHHGGHTGDPVDALVQDILQRQILGVLVVRNTGPERTAASCS